MDVLERLMFLPSNIRRLLLIIPFMYTLTTRLNSRRDFLYNLAMAWLPALALLGLQSERTSLAVISHFSIGYLAFISIYEIGYLANDVWDARRDPNGRERIKFALTPAWIFVFVVSRLLCFAVVAISTGWWANLYWISGFILLVFIFALHNLLQKSYRIATFPVLTVLRFILPIIGSIDILYLKIALAVASVPYLMPRWFAYAESKGLLDVRVRQAPSFRSLFLVGILPIAVLASYSIDSWAPLAFHAYYLLVTLAGERVSAMRHQA